MADVAVGDRPGPLWPSGPRPRTSADPRLLARPTSGRGRALSRNGPGERTPSLVATTHAERVGSYKSTATASGANSWRHRLAVSLTVSWRSRVAGSDWATWWSSWSKPLASVKRVRRSRASDVRASASPNMRRGEPLPQAVGRDSPMAGTLPLKLAAGGSRREREGAGLRAARAAGGGDPETPAK